MGHLTIRLVSGLILLMIITSSSWAGTWDMNPGQVAVKHRNDMSSDVTGHGYMMEYANVNTNNLSMLEYAHGSGAMDYAEVLADEQKTMASTTKIYWIDYTTNDFKSAYVGANSIISYTKQYDNVQAPTSFAYGTGWYASHPVVYNSLLKDKNDAKSYQEAAAMQRQVEYARALNGDIAVDMNCTSPTALVSGKGSISMKFDDDVTSGTLHASELLSHTLKSTTVKGSSAITSKPNSLQGWRNPIIEIESNYVGDFQVQKNMKIDITKSAPTWGEDWLPCCSGGFFDLPSRFFDKQYGSQKGIFDCTCRNTSISTMQPKWNTTLAQFPTEKYQYKP